MQNSGESEREKQFSFDSANEKTSKNENNNLLEDCMNPTATSGENHEITKTTATSQKFIEEDDQKEKEEEGPIAEGLEENSPMPLEEIEDEEITFTRETLSIEVEVEDALTATNQLEETTNEETLVEEIPASAEQEEEPVCEDEKLINIELLEEEEEDENMPLDIEFASECEDEYIQITSKNGNCTVELPLESRVHVKLIDKILEGDVNARHITINYLNITQSSLDTIHDYVLHHLEHGKSQIVRNSKKKVWQIYDAFDFQILENMSFEELCELLSVVQYLSIDGLQNLLAITLLSRLEKLSQTKMKTILSECCWDSTASTLEFVPQDLRVALKNSKKKNLKNDLAINLDNNGQPIEEDEHSSNINADSQNEEESEEIFLSKSRIITLKASGTSDKSKDNRFSALRKVLEAMINPEEDFVGHKAVMALGKEFWNHMLMEYCTAQTRFPMSAWDLRLSKILSEKLKNEPELEEFEIEAIPSTMKYICTYLQYHEGIRPPDIAKPIRSIKMEKIVEDVWDAGFINGLSKRELFQVILGANHIKCECLLHLGCAKVSTMIKGKSPEEIKQILGEDDPESEDEDAEVVPEVVEEEPAEVVAEVVEEEPAEVVAEVVEEEPTEVAAEVVEEEPANMEVEPVIIQDLLFPAAASQQDGNVPPIDKIEETIHSDIRDNGRSQVICIPQEPLAISEENQNSVIEMQETCVASSKLDSPPTVTSSSKQIYDDEQTAGIITNDSQKDSKCSQCCCFKIW